MVAPRDMVRWGPLWAGVMVALATYLVLQLTVFALNLYTDDGAWWSSISALVAFFIGGGSSSARRPCGTRRATGRSTAP